MSYARIRPQFSAFRLALWLLNIPVGLIGFYIGFYAFAGLWHPNTPGFLRLLAAVQPLVVGSSWAISTGKWSAGASKVANFWLLAPMLSLTLWAALMQVWIRL